MVGLNVVSVCLTFRFVGAKKSLADFGVTSAAAKSGGDSKAADNDDDLDLFGDDDEVTDLDLPLYPVCNDRSLLTRLL